MHETELLLLGLLVFLPGLTVLARAVDVPYPIVLVLGGLALGLLPGVPEVELRPGPGAGHLPAAAAVRRRRSSPTCATCGPTPARSRCSSVGLVLFTTVAVAVVAHAADRGLPWAAAFALGAIVSPTDPVAATTIARRLGAPRRIVTILEGESLVNDATALVAYRVAVGGGDRRHVLALRGGAASSSPRSRRASRSASPSAG